MNAAFGVQACEDDGSSPGHEGHCLSPVTAGHDRRKINAGSLRDLFAGNIRFQPGGFERANIDADGLMPASADQLVDIGMFVSLGIKGPENRNGRHGWIE